MASSCHLQYCVSNHFYKDYLYMYFHFEISHIHGRVFVSLANEKIVVFHRNTGKNSFEEKNKDDIIYFKMVHGI